ncbi:UPF0674 endoplasmic reticulum membrane protein [Fulvia fulva]|uniref:UPF0674 endoplasmic reticulum membrane protein n=1 Tax=Passalora fulva TaxID=5499 RepID=A0A9Q8LHR6_PASFU|nr:UPF0674 endoplasmic reticulum membrane protein [Fulvia fulva]KAK4623737.1 UPF0674 endoplasmic reticulum membrane protein [Fulvia fulva]KAK4626036.1 UPF0674 endoplasmic reticulum membrane protein [Fulvia fulva]UJO17628.1 UPF0674 endoplasmic reticulum membrane protein [Fulvia fulva]WPV14616.1 UPF0674 endoplasmic reticulum membrane protein [Fulvia fulva]WPV29520.1 UPF0674 endoplasmic reticulum membrane protein [Fulvia fulva]
MAGLIKKAQEVLGGAASSASSAIPSDADDFADFATAASPVAPGHAATSAFSEAAATASSKPMFPGFGAGQGMAGRPYTKWYRVWERVTIADFYQEMVILPVILIIILINMWGAATNKQKARQWAQTHLPLLESEFASLGFNPKKESRPTGTPGIPDDFYKEKSKFEWISYATGRQNVAWLDIKLTLHKRYNPVVWGFEYAASFFFESMPAPVERLEATAYAFDGKEKELIPSASSKDSKYDGFVWAVVHKDKMKQLRDDRYDVSLTSTKDHPKLPQWATVMSESAEVTEAMLTPELIKAVTEAGEDLEALIVSDQPIDAPKKLNDTMPKKRVSLSMRLDSKPDSTALFAYFLRMPDHLVNSAHFRPEAMRKIRATREEEQRKLRKIHEDEKAEERRTQSDKLKKEERDRKLSRMSADEQKKFLEKEKDKQQRKGMKKQTQRA